MIILGEYTESKAFFWPSKLSVPGIGDNPFPDNFFIGVV